MRSIGIRFKRALLVITVLAGSLCVSCTGGDDDNCGLVEGEIVVVFKEGITRSEVDAINAEIGATVIEAPVLSTAYDIRLPDGMTFEEASGFYEAKPQVQGVLWSVNSCPDEVD